MLLTAKKSGERCLKKDEKSTSARWIEAVDWKWAREREKERNKMWQQYLEAGNIVLLYVFPSHRHASVWQICWRVTLLCGEDECKRCLFLGWKVNIGIDIWSWMHISLPQSKARIMPDYHRSIPARIISISIIGIFQIIYIAIPNIVTGSTLLARHIVVSFSFFYRASTSSVSIASTSCVTLTVQTSQMSKLVHT